MPFFSLLLKPSFSSFTLSCLQTRRSGETESGVLNRLGVLVNMLVEKPGQPSLLQAQVVFFYLTQRYPGTGGVHGRNDCELVSRRSAEHFPRGRL